MIQKIKVEEAIGKPLLHDITAIQTGGFKGPLFRRNHIISEEDIEKLKDIGKEHVYVGSLEEGQVHEEDAISELAPLIAGENVSYGSPSEGKIGFKSKVRGLFQIDEASVFQINSVGDYTLVSVENNKVVDENENLAGGRIVPFYTSRDVVDRAKKVAKENPVAYRVLPFQTKRVGIVITGSEIFSGRIADRFEPMIRNKLSFYGAEVVSVEFAPDDLEVLHSRIDEALEKKVDLILMSGGMSVDPDDMTPTAIRNKSDEFLFQGVPVQPGNMLTVGMKKGTYIVGVPGASIHAPKTSLDLFLPRFFANVPIRHEDFLRMSVGGLL